MDIEKKIGQASDKLFAFLSLEGHYANCNCPNCDRLSRVYEANEILKEIWTEMVSRARAQKAGEAQASTKEVGEGEGPLAFPR